MSASSGKSGNGKSGLQRLCGEENHAEESHAEGSRESKSRMFSNGHSMDKPRFTEKWKQKSPAQDEERLQRGKRSQVCISGLTRVLC